jgi:hypothetical protein
MSQISFEKRPLSDIICDMPKAGRKIRRSQTDPEIVQPAKRIYRRAYSHNVRRAKAQLQFCRVCNTKFYSIRSDAKTCSEKCRKAFSRSPAGHMARLKRLGGNKRKQAQVITLELLEAWRLPVAKR